MLDRLTDNRVNCYSILVPMKVQNYLELVERAYRKSGGILGQRSALKSRTGLLIRKRLVNDIRQGAIIPPVVVGMLLSHEKYAALADSVDIADFLSAAQEEPNVRIDGGERISVIDGMQRTTALHEAAEGDNTVYDRTIRVEIWVADKASSLIYRMLVLNTGQVPWDISRQLETIYGQFLIQISETVGTDLVIFPGDDRKRRVQPAQYQGKDIIQLLLLFSSRKLEIDIKDKVAEDFARLDAIETTSDSRFIDYFIETLQNMALLDRQFSRLSNGENERTRIRVGKDIFGSFPAMVGFFNVVSIELFDEPGFELDWTNVETKHQKVMQALTSLIAKLAEIQDEKLEDFLQLSVLEERLSQRSGQVGRFERDLYRKAFASMLRNHDRLPNLVPCWTA